MTLSASVIVPTHNRPDALLLTLDGLLAAARIEAEILVVDDGSTPPLSLPITGPVRLIRTSGVERSRARNQGACAARGERLIFVDDDISVSPDFVSRHVQAGADFGDVIGVGRISLPPGIERTAFGRFRLTIENPGQDRPRGLVPEENLCTAANMSMRRSTFLELGGFDPAILSGEDQDLALRFSARGGRIAFLPEADVIHRDAVAGIKPYCQRHEWGAAAMAPLLRRHADRPDNRRRLELSHPLDPERPAQAIRILLRRMLSHPGSMGLIQFAVAAAERAGAGDRALFPLYRVLLGLSLFRGFRSGLARFPAPPVIPKPLTGSIGGAETD